MTRFSSLIRHQQIKNFLRQLAIRLCRVILNVSSKPYRISDNITVVIAPHQDDESLGCGGLIARKRNEGLPVHVIFITDGAASHPDHPRLSSTALAALRRTEAMHALACLNVERNAAHFINEPDGTLKNISMENRENLVTRLVELLSTIAPTAIFLPCNPDGSSEHDATFGFVFEAISRSRLQPEIWQYPVWSWWNPHLVLKHWFTSNDCRRLPLEDYRRAKHLAIQCYQSQIKPLAPDTQAALPIEMVKLFFADNEFYFRYNHEEKEP